MTAALNELIEKAKQLPRDQKLYLVRELVDALAREEGAAPQGGSLRAEVWSPFDATEAADVMLRALRADEP